MPLFGGAKIRIIQHLCGKPLTMKKAALFLLPLLVACQPQYDFYGEEFSMSESQTSESVLAELSDGTDSVTAVFTAPVTGVCQKKGCWMELDMGNDQSALVRFKDYGFFSPMNAEGAEVTVHGVVKVDTLSVAWLRHQASDAGESDSAIALINEPVVKVSVMASGIAYEQGAIEIEVEEAEEEEEAEVESAEVESTES